MFQYRCIAIGVLRLIFDNPAIRRIVMKITKEENRVYSLYTCGIGGGSGRKTGVMKLSTKEELLKIVVLRKENITTK